MSVTFSGYTRSTTLTNFPTLVTLSTNTSGFDYTGFLSTNGYDVRFWDVTRTDELNYEIEEWNTNGESFLWVQVTNLTSNTVVWMSWGTTNYTNQAVCTTNGATWNSDYLGVWHLHADEDDSTSNTNNGINNSSTNVSSAVVADGQGFNGSSHYVNINAVANDFSDNDITWSGWVKTSDSVGSLVACNDSGGNNKIMAWSGGGVASEYCIYDGAAWELNSGFTIADGEWHRFVYTRNGTTGRAYVNGAQRGGTHTADFNLLSSDLWSLAMEYDGGPTPSDYLQGFLDEVRIEDVARPTDWIWAEWMNMASNNVFNEYLISTTNPPSIVNTAATATTATNATLGGVLSSNIANVIVYYGTDTNSWSHTNSLGELAPGSFSTTATGLLYGVQYYYRCYATNDYGEGWAPSAQPFLTVRPDGQSGPVTNGSASAITTTSAVLNATLSATDSVFHVYAYWGTTDGGSNASAWENSAYVGSWTNVASTNVSHAATTLLAGADYYYTFCASNAATNIWASPSAAFNTAIPLDAFQYRMKITFTGYDKSETLANFPALVVLNTNLTNFAYSQFASSSGWDLRFANEDETRILNYEIEEWNTSSNSYVWVQVPVFTNNCYIWAYWGNAAAGQEDYTTNGSAWSEGFQAVWHLHSDGNDSTAGNHDCADNGTSATNGMIAAARSFSSADLTATGYKGVTGTTERTVSAWVKTATAADQSFIAWGTGSAGKKWVVRLEGDGDLRAEISTGYRVGTTDIDNGEWHHAAVTLDDTVSPNADDLKLYVDGAEDSYSATNPQALDTANSEDVLIGRDYETTIRHWDGELDEIRISSVARSTDWIWAEWMNMASNSAFVTYAAVTTNQLASVDNDADGASGITASSAYLNGALTATGTFETAVWVYWGTVDGNIYTNLWQSSRKWNVPQTPQSYSHPDLSKNRAFP